jgi:hypothetical protein
MELVNDVSVTRDNLRATLALALKDRADMLSEITTMRGQLEKFTVGADAGSLDRGSTSYFRQPARVM